MKEVKEWEKFLRRARVSADMSQKDVADHFGYSTPQFVSNWERGESYPPYEVIRELAILYKVDLKIFFNYLIDSKTEAIRAEVQEFLSGSNPSKPKDKRKKRKSRAQQSHLSPS